MIQVNNISKSFDDIQVLDDVSITFEEGKTNLIIGQSGSGKTVLLKCIVGLHEIDKGEILFDTEDFSKMNFKQRKAIRKEIGMVFQGGALFDSASVEENIMYPLDMFTNQTLEEKLDRVYFCLRKVRIENAGQKFPSELSGGMRKRVAIARAIALNPKYLLCDEPNSGLDPKTSIIVDNLIKEITNEFSMTTIINTHDMNSVVEIGDQVVFINKGKKCWEGSSKDIFTSDNKDMNDFVFASKLYKQIREFHK